MQIDNLLLEKSLGSGTFGKVFYTTIKGDPLPYATKMYDREKIQQNPSLYNYLKGEIAILNKLDHPNIIKLKDVKVTKKHYYIVMEYCNGGELQEVLNKYKKKISVHFRKKLCNI